MGQGEERKKQVLMGRIAGAHGVRGWVRIISYTEPREAIVNYSPWIVGEERLRMTPREGGRHGKAVIAGLQGVHDRDAAAALTGLEIWVEREDLPEPGQGRYYWADLVGMEVVLEHGEGLGTITGMMATGANDVMVVEGDRQRLIPFVQGETVLGVDLNAKQVRVRWDRDF